MCESGPALASRTRVSPRHPLVDAMSAGVGFVLAVSSAILNGSFVVFSKLPRVKAAGVDPLVFQMYDRHDPDNLLFGPAAPPK